MHGSRVAEGQDPLSQQDPEGQGAKALLSSEDGPEFARTTSITDASEAPTAERVSLKELFVSVKVVSLAFFVSPQTRLRAWSMTMTIVAFMLGISVTSMWFVGMIGKMQNALHDSDGAKFRKVMHILIVVSLIFSFVAAVTALTKGLFCLAWRQYLTKRLLAGYVSDNQAFYRLKLKGSSIDNPDQRITQDVDQFTSTVVDFATTIVISVLQGISFSSKLWSFSSRLFAFVVVWALCLNVLNFGVFGGPLTRLTRLVFAQEASLRYALMRVRENAEPIAFYRGAVFEKKHCESLFATLLHTLYRKLYWNSTFQMLAHFSTQFAEFFPYMILADEYFKGQITFGQMGEATISIRILMASFSTLVGQMDGITNIGAQAIRVHQLWDALATIDGCDNHGPKSSLKASLCDFRVIHQAPLGEDADVLLRMCGVTLQPPVGSVPLVRGLSLELQRGQSLLISGPSGIGKSSLLRAIGGLWAGGRGSIESPGPSKCFFVPQEPYLCKGNLRENCTYPGPGPEAATNDLRWHEGPSRAEVQKALTDVGLEYLVSRYGLDTNVNLDSILSGGERQRVGFVRLLLRPRLQFAILDEATSALDEVMESTVYHLLAKRVEGFISVGHRPALAGFHTHRLLLSRLPEGGCSWQFEQTTIPERCSRSWSK